MTHYKECEEITISKDLGRTEIHELGRRGQYSFFPTTMAEKSDLKIAGWVKNNKPNPRPDWIEYYLDMAEDASKRSHDSETKCGAIITDKDFKILGSGYNAFPADVEDSLLPNYRPDKYGFVIHSEINAILNCHTKPDKNGKIFITAAPCLSCLIMLWQFGIREVYHKQVLVNMTQNEEYLVNRAIFDKVSGGRMTIQGF